ncbi:MAG: epoxyqueuosine reductase QueH [Eubacteriales bacterium]
MGNVNYQRELDNILSDLPTIEPPKSLLLHSCCAPCSTYVLKYLSQYFAITLYFYNPNITEEIEYQRRLLEQRRLIETLNKTEKVKYLITIIEAPYEVQEFHDCVKGLEQELEGGKRCEACFRLRLEASAKIAKELGSDYFTTTLTISPRKNSKLLNEVGQEVAERYQEQFLPSDFKKKEGYKQSVQLSELYELYRQDYCGCVYSKRQREEEVNKK